MSTAKKGPRYPRIQALYDYLPYGRRAAFAEVVGVSTRYLTRVILGYERAGPKLAIRIEEASRRKVDRADVRPDLFRRARKKKAATAAVAAAA